MHRVKLHSTFCWELTETQSLTPDQATGGEKTPF